MVLPKLNGRFGRMIVEKSSAEDAVKASPADRESGGAAG
jgi:hypothetical protein